MWLSLKGKELMRRECLDGNNNNNNNLYSSYYMPDIDILIISEKILWI